MIEKETKLEFLQRQSHDQLVTFILNSDMREEMFAEKLFLLTGCGSFGSQDGTCGGCVECFYNNRDLHDRCCLFQMALHSYRTTKYAQIREKAKEKTEDIICEY